MNSTNFFFLFLSLYLFLSKRFDFNTVIIWFLTNHFTAEWQIKLKYNEITRQSKIMYAWITQMQTVFEIDSATFYIHWWWSEIVVNISKPWALSHIQCDEKKKKTLATRCEILNTKKKKKTTSSTDEPTTTKTMNNRYSCDQHTIKANKTKQQPKRWFCDYTQCD